MPTVAITTPGGVLRVPVARHLVARASAIHRRGDSLSWACVLANDSGAPIDITALTIRAQIRDATDALLAGMTVVVADAAAGAFVLSVAATATADWAPGSYVLDVEFTSGTDVMSTDTIVLRVVADVSRAS